MWTYYPMKMQSLGELIKLWFKDIQLNVKSLSFLNANIRSNVKNLDAFKTFLFYLNHKFSFIACCCTENWLKHKNASYNIDRYFHEYNIRDKKQGGGVSLFIKISISYIIRNDITLTDSFNCLAIEVFQENFNINKNIIIIVIYRPSTLLKVFNDEFPHILRSIMLEFFFTCVLGDYNVNTYSNSEHNNIHIPDFSNLFMLNCFTRINQQEYFIIKSHYLIIFILYWYISTLVSMGSYSQMN